MQPIKMYGYGMEGELMFTVYGAVEDCPIEIKSGSKEMSSIEQSVYNHMKGQYDTLSYVSAIMSDMCFNLQTLKR